MLELQLMLLETVLTMLMCLQGNLLRGIDIWLGVAYTGLKSFSGNNFVTSEYIGNFKKLEYENFVQLRNCKKSWL